MVRHVPKLAITSWMKRGHAPSSVWLDASASEVSLLTKMENVFEEVRVTKVEVLLVDVTGSIDGAGQHVRRDVLIEVCRGPAENSVSKGVSVKRDMCLTTDGIVYLDLLANLEFVLCKKQ